MSSRLFIHSANVHIGGGRSLLHALLCALPEHKDITAILDKRMDIPEGLDKKTVIKRVTPLISDRFYAEWCLRNSVKTGDMVLSFGNLPPLFKLKGYTKVFLQNRYLIDDKPLTGFPVKTYLRLVMERLWVKSRFLNADEFIVQTPSMKTRLEKLIKNRRPVKVLPFTLNNEGYSRIANDNSTVRETHVYDFAYIASGEPHKNHRTLLDAWCIMAGEGYYPSLCLTVDKQSWPDLFNLIKDKKNNFSLKINNLGLLSHEEVQLLYKKVKAMIYPSTFESFGLPMIEARQAGLPVLASELDYVRDVLDPEESFDPDSAISISRAVKRFLGIKEEPLQLLDAESFMKYIMEKIE